jgi:hypothetical protein
MRRRRRRQWRPKCNQFLRIFSDNISVNFQYMEQSAARLDAFSVAPITVT